MPTPEFVLELRKKIGTRPLWLSGVTAVVLDEPGERILLIRRADTGEWAPITGIIDPAEQPAVAAAREVLVRCSRRRMSSSASSDWPAST
jgi:hypothetical protein